MNLPVAEMNKRENNKDVKKIPFFGVAKFSISRI